MMGSENGDICTRHSKLVPSTSGPTVRQPQPLPFDGHERATRELQSTGCPIGDDANTHQSTGEASTPSLVMQ